jgi:hypothetical protein
MSDRLRHDLADLAQEVQIVDLTHRARTASRRTGVRRAVVAGVAAVLLVVVGTVAFLRFGPDRSVPPTNPTPTMPTPSTAPSSSAPRSLFNFPAPPSSVTKLGPWTSVPAGAFPGQAVFFASSGGGYSVQILADSALRTSSLGRLDEQTSCILQSITASPDGRSVAWVRGSINVANNQLVVSDLYSPRVSAVADNVGCADGPVWSADSWSIDITRGNVPVTVALDSGTTTRQPDKLRGYHEYVPGLMAYQADGHIVVENATGILHRVPYNRWPTVGFSVQALSYDGRYVGVNFRNTDPDRVDTVAQVVDMTTGQEIKLPVPAGQNLADLQFLPDGGMVMQTTNRLIRFDRTNAVVAQIVLPAGTGSLMRYVA